MFRNAPRKPSSRKNQRIRQLRHEHLEDRRLLAGVTPNDPLFADQWTLKNTGQSGGTWDADIDVPAAWSVTTGSASTVVAVLDTGIDYTHEDLYLNIWINQGEIPASIASTLSDTDGDFLFTFRDLNDAANAGKVPDINTNGYIDAGDLLNNPAWEDGVDTDGNNYTDDLVGWDWVNNDNDPMDENGHGTAVSGLLGAVGDNGVGTAGVNWSVQMMPLRFKFDNPTWTVDAAVSAIDYAVENGAPISCNSWGTSDEYPQPIYDAIARAGDAGHLFVSAAGNLSQSIDPGFLARYPAGFDLDSILSVGATNHEDHLADFSDWGVINVDLAAPGKDVLVLRMNNTYSPGSGTSYSTPHVAGVVALLKSVHPDWDAAQLKQQIMDTVDPLTSLDGLTVTGGRLNAAAALGVTSIEDLRFSDSFGSVQWNGLWVEDSQNDWITSTQRATDGNYSAEVDGRAADATLTANSADLTQYGSAELTFDWHIESSLDSGEYLAVDLFDGSDWTEAARLSGNVDPENTWHSETIAIDGAYLVGNFQFRFRAKMSKSDEDANVDNVKLVATSMAGPANNVPVANGESYDAVEDTPLSISAPGVLGNDSDADMEPLTASLATNASNGSVTLSADGSFSYTPNENFNGTDSFTYRAFDGNDYSAPATVTIDVAAVNDNPVAVNDTATTQEDTPVVIPVLANDSDVDLDSLVVQSVTAAANGLVEINYVDKTVTYTPNAGFKGPSDSFTYTVSDGKGGTAVATVDITVTPSNDAPVVIDHGFETLEDTLLTVAAPGVLTDAFDGDGDPFTAVLVSGPSSGDLTLNSDGSFTYDPNDDFNGVDSFTYQADDGLALSNTGTVTLTVTAVNDAPVAQDDAATTAEDTGVTVDVLDNDSDIDSESLTVSISTAPSNGTAVVNTLDNTITYTPDSEFHGLDTFQYQVSDGAGGVDIGEVTVDVAEAVTTTGMGVADIWFDSNRRDRDWRAVVDVRDENGDAVVGATVTVLFRGVTYTGQTDSTGSYYTGWSMNVKSGTYYADVVDVALQDYLWDRSLDVEVDSDNDGLIDDVLYR